MAFVYYRGSVGVAFVYNSGSVGVALTTDLDSAGCDISLHWYQSGLGYV